MSVFYEKGRYRCRISKQGLTAASTGTTQFFLQFDVLARVIGPNAEAEVQQYTRTMFRAITEKTIPYLLEDLQALGFHGGSFAELDPDNSSHQSFVGQEIAMYCNHETDQKGSPREKWGVARSAGEMEVRPPEKTEIRKLDALFGKQLRAACGTHSNVKPMPQPLGVGASDIDDVPF